MSNIFTILFYFYYILTMLTHTGTRTHKYQHIVKGKGKEIAFYTYILLVLSKYLWSPKNFKYFQNDTESFHILYREMKREKMGLTHFHPLVIQSKYIIIKLRFVVNLLIPCAPIACQIRFLCMLS